MQNRGRVFVWFLISLFNPLLLLTFWRGALDGSGWSLSAMYSYYFLLVIAGALLMSHIEEDVAFDDIHQGALAMYLTKPFSYFWIKFINELPYRVLQGSFGIIVCILFILLYGQFFAISNNGVVIIYAVIIAILAYFIAFIFKMSMGLTAFWFLDAKGFFNLIEIMMLIFCGYIMPISLFVPQLAFIANMTPFPYMIYYPIVAFQGELSFERIISVILMQSLWIVLFVGVYKMLWYFGVKKFTGMGQ